MECCPYERNYAQGGNQWLEPRITAGDGSWTERDCGCRLMTGDGSREMDQGRRMIIILLSYMKLRSYNRARICRHTVFKRHGSTKYDAKHYSNHYSEHYSKIPNHVPTCPCSNAEYDPESDPE